MPYPYEKYPVKLVAGETFQYHCRTIKNPHWLEGAVYKDNGGDISMFCQVGYRKFAMISLTSGNRHNNPINSTLNLEDDSTTRDAWYREMLFLMGDELDGDNFVYVGRLYMQPAICTIIE